MNEKLNEKLARWVGFIRLPIGNKGYHFEHGAKVMNWQPPKEDWVAELERRNIHVPDVSVDALPDFTRSLDACQKWLIPNIEYFELRGQLYLKSNFACCAMVRTFAGIPDKNTVGGVEMTASAKNPALALCLAIEKLIDAEAK